MTTNKNEKFNVVTEMDERACTVFLSGEMDLSVAPEFRLVMEPLVGEAEQDLIINMKDLKYIDSTGIGILLSILKARHGMNASFTVEEVPPQIQKLFEMTGIAKFFVPQENSQ
ncbi:STAS domain-containing protein [Paenibacillus sp. PK4536]|uniref:Anti-sigma factor antagonist n=3 Tax=Paenibacillus TaxID=44249 RepID=A0A1E3L9X5_9BACL|nr:MULTISPECIES: STAS domain-containing protein [Paenibacillus]MDN4620399.1 STAS domain-containing protein [Paenibacillus sp. PsM32]MDQ1235619.1 anti-sigma B factor antagonist [Paenibacillus sp. SORGH_AS_0306]MDR6112667.1 anti-sigma B factor antagonist [Paenibacillus sp. SORGH_AS_0338]ODP30391.1 Anti-sigma-B factor antagonist [Paenibacillus nuruki]TKJ83334.1 anti-sigma factor antagonist [Paenibacillus sp. CFBP13512]